MLHSVADRRRVKGGETEGKKGGGDSISFSPFREANGGGSEQGRKPSSSLACSSASPLFFLPRQRCSSAPRERRKKPSVDVPAVSKRAVLAAGRGEARPQSSGKFEPFFPFVSIKEWRQSDWVSFSVVTVVVPDACIFVVRGASCEICIGSCGLPPQDIA